MRFSLKAQPVREAAALAIALLAVASAVRAQPHPAFPTQTMPAEAMARAGLTRTADLFWLLEGWNAPSLDGYAVRPSSYGMPGAPLLVAGGQPFGGGPFGQPPLPVLPVHLKQVRKAEASPAPQLVDGRLAPNGMVRLRLHKPAEGASAHGAVSAGNEVGDPGPFRTTERSVPNVDRIGPQYLAETSLGDAQTGAQLSLRALRHYTTDRAIRARTENANDPLDGPPLQHLTAPRLALWTDEPRFGQHRLTAHYATLRALPFLETLGYEVPARRQHAKIGLDGAFPPLTDPSGRLRYRLSYTRATLASDATRFRNADRSALMFDWTENRLSAHAALEAIPLRLARQPLALRFGLSADYTRARASGDVLNDPTLLTTRAYARLTPNSSSAFRPRLALLLSQTDGQAGGGALFSTVLPLSAGQHLGIHLAYVRRPYAEGGSFWYWLRQGLRPPQAPAGQVTLPPSFPASQRLTADLRLRHAFSGNGHLALELRTRHLHHLPLPHSDFGYDPIYFPAYAPPGGRLVPDLRLRTDAGGQTVRAAVEGERAFPKELTHRLRYDFFAHHATGKDASREAFDQRFQRTPRHQVRYAARLAIRDRFSLEGRLTVRSPEHWPAYRRAARAAHADGGSYRSRLPTRARLDLTATKRLWHDHLRLRLALRNLLDAPLRTHPAGPARRLSLFVSLEASL